MEMFLMKLRFWFDLIQTQHARSLDVTSSLPAAYFTSPHHFPIHDTISFMPVTPVMLRRRARLGGRMRIPLVQSDSDTEPPWSYMVASDDRGKGIIRL